MPTERHMTPIPAVAYGRFKPSMPEVQEQYPGRLGRPKAPIEDGTCRKFDRMTYAFFALSTVALGVASAVIPSEVTQVLEKTAEQLGVLEDERMLKWMLIGAFLGAWVNVGIFRPKQASELVWKWATSFAIAVLFSPWLIEYMEWSRSSTMALAFSGAAAILGWTLIHRLTPLAETLATTRIGKILRAIFGIEEEKPEKKERTVKPQNTETLQP